MTSNNPNKRNLRIIGGLYRSRKIDFAPDPAIRPTPDRIRETLFNWLQDTIQGSRCLELYSGSGILSIESLSRGAKHVTVIDQSAQACNKIRANISKLGIAPSQVTCVEAKALDWLSNHKQERWDLIFLDPPFASDELNQLLPLIAEYRLLAKDGFLYIESPNPITLAELPPGWAIHRNKKASKVNFCLCYAT